MIVQSVLDLVGATPIVHLTRLPGAQHKGIYAKYEAFNPAGSVKDRLALGVILDAEKRGDIKPGDTIVECTSGNVGIAFSMVAAARGYRFVAVMGDGYSIERRKLITLFGGEVLLFPSELGSSGGNSVADDLAQRHGWFRPRQFENRANPDFHMQTTASEILQDFAGQPLDAFIAGHGTGGTITGVGHMLRAARPSTQIIGVEPEGAAVMQGQKWNVHEIQGLAPNFEPQNLDATLVDRFLTVPAERARETALNLAQYEGLMVGMSAGANVYAALQVAHELGPESTVLTILPDTGERYLSSYLAAELPEPRYIDGHDD